MIYHVAHVSGDVGTWATTCYCLPSFPIILILFFFYLKNYANDVLIYCLDMSDKHMHPRSLNIPINDHFPGCVSNLTRFSYCGDLVKKKIAMDIFMNEIL